MKRLILIASTLALSACAHGGFDTDRSELTDARDAIKSAKDAGAEKCAPKLQAQAVGALYWAAHEYSEHDVHPDENEYLANRAKTKAEEALAKARKGCKPEIIALEGVNFDHDSAELTPASTATLDRAVGTLTKRDSIRVEVAAHTDSDGSAGYNEALSQRRATSVMEYLKAHGIDASRLSSKGYGESQPLVSNATKEGRARNRRVELRVMN